MWKRIISGLVIVAALTAMGAAVRLNVASSAGKPLVVVAAGEPEASYDGLTLEVVDASIGPLGLSVRVEARGRDDLGDSLRLLGPAFVVGANGSRMVESGGRSLGRSVELYFNDVRSDNRSTQDSRTLELQLDRVGLSQGAARAQEIGRPATRWSLKFQARLHTADVVSARGTAGFGPGQLSVTELVLDENFVEVRGTLDDFTDAELSGLLLQAVTLADSSGVALVPVAGRHGFGEGRRQFSFRFLRSTGSSRPEAFGVSLGLVPGSSQAPETQRLAAAVGARIAITIEGR
jgi:hypothetical protein